MTPYKSVTTNGDHVGVRSGKLGRIIVVRKRLPTGSSLDMDRMASTISATIQRSESVYGHIDGFLVVGVSLKLEFAEIVRTSVRHAVSSIVCSVINHKR